MPPVTGMQNVLWWGLNLDAQRGLIAQCTAEGWSAQTGMATRAGQRDVYSYLNG